MVSDQISVCFLIEAVLFFRLEYPNRNTHQPYAALKLYRDENQYLKLINFEKNAKNDKRFNGLNGASFERILRVSDKRYVIGDRR